MKDKTIKLAIKKLNKQFTRFAKSICKKHTNKTMGIWGYTIEHIPTETTAFSTSDFDQITDYFTTKGVNNANPPIVWYKGKEMTFDKFRKIYEKKNKISHITIEPSDIQ